MSIKLYPGLPEEAEAPASVGEGEIDELIALEHQCWRHALTSVAAAVVSILCAVAVAVQVLP